MTVLSTSNSKARIIVGGYLREFEESESKQNNRLRIPRALNGVFLVFYLGRWEQLEDTPYKVMFNTLTINNAIFFFPDFVDGGSHAPVPLNNYIAQKYVDAVAYRPECYKYDAETRQYSEFTTYPQGVMSISKTVSYCPKSDRVTIIGGTHGVFASLNLNGVQYTDSDDLPVEPQWDLTRNFHGLYETTGSNPSSIYIDGKFHMIGGHNSYYHEVWDDRQHRMKPVFRFGSRIKGRELVYVRQLDSLIMFGGCLWDERNFQQTQRFRYIDAFYQCVNPNDLEHIQWRKIKWHLPYKMIGFGHLLLDDTKLLIFGGRRSGGAFLDEVWMFDMIEESWSRSTIKIPQKGKYRAHLIENKKQSEIHLFQYGHPKGSNLCHFRMGLLDLLNSMEAVNPLSLTKAISKQRASRVAPNIKAMNAIADRLTQEEDLSKNQRKKLVKKFMRKVQRQCQQQWARRQCKIERVSSWATEEGQYQ